jgi:hypothetical protein
LKQNQNQFHPILCFSQITAHGLVGWPADLERTGIFPARWRGRMCEKENSGWQIGLTFWLLLGQAKSNKSYLQTSLIRPNLNPWPSGLPRRFKTNQNQYHRPAGRRVALIFCSTFSSRKKWNAYPAKSSIIES